MNKDQKIEKVRAYIITLGRLQRKCEEAARWDSMSEGCELDGSNLMKTTSIQIRAECEQLAAKTNALRQCLASALEQMPNERRREVLELFYLSGLGTAQICQRTGWSKQYVLRLRSEALEELDTETDFFHGQCGFG